MVFGIGTAKNLALAGPNAIVIHDDALVELRDFGSNIYLTPEDVGRRRGESYSDKASRT